MKTLMLLRHGKSPRPDGVPDHKRPVKKKAARQISEVAGQLRRDGRQPQRVLSSDALRASQSAEAFCQGADCGRPVLLSGLYNASAEAILETLREAGATAKAVLVVGHNPGMEDCCERLHPGCLPEAHLRTGAIAIFSVDIDDWAHIDAERGTLEQIIDTH